MLAGAPPLSKTPTPGNFETDRKNKYVYQMTQTKDTQDYHNLHRALNELVVRLVRNQFSEHDEDEFFRFAREADKRDLLGFYVNRQQRMIDEGCDPVSAYNWAYNDVLNYNEQ